MWDEINRVRSIDAPLGGTTRTFEVELFDQAGNRASDTIEITLSCGVDLAVLSLTNPDVSELADDTAGRIRAAATPTIVGGPGRSLEQLVDEARASTSAATAAK